MIAQTVKLRHSWSNKTGFSISKVNSRNLLLEQQWQTESSGMDGIRSADAGEGSLTR